MSKGRLDLVIAKFIGHIGILGAPLGLAIAVVQCSAALRGASMGRIGRGGGEAAAAASGTSRTSSASASLGQHTILGLGRGPVHGL